MKHRTAFVIAAALTAFVLIFVGGITVVVTPKAAAFNPSPTPTDAPTQAPTDTATATLAPSATATQVLQAKTAAPQVSVLTSDQALKVAMRLAPQAKLEKDPELVNFKGHMAYEVLLDVGAVYIDALSGKVLFSGIGLAPTPAPPPPTTDPGGGGGGGGGHNGGQGQGQGNAPAPNPGPQGPPSGGHGAGGGHGGRHDDGGGHGGGDD